MTDTTSPTGAPTDPQTVMVGIANPVTIDELMDLTARLVGDTPARVLAAHVVVVPTQMALSSARSSPAVAAASTLLRAAIDAASAHGVVADGVVEIGREVHEGLAAAVESREADLLVMGWSEDEVTPHDDAGESAFDKLMHRVAGSVECDLVVAKLRGDALQRVLVPISDSPHVTLLAYLVRRLAASGSDVTFLHVIDEDADADAARTAIQALLEGHGLAGLAPLDVVAADSPTEGILARAGDHDVAVLGAAAKPALAEVLFGSKAAKVAAQAPCSVLLARARTA